MSLEKLREKAKNLPITPGVYLMKDFSNKIIYVGKAKNLKSRVRSYFNSKESLPYKVQKMVAQVRDFDILQVNTEVEALLLERTLIKSHAPQFNILLRDDKEYPYIRIDLESEWPRIRKVRRKKNDKSVYLGPFAKVGDLNTSLQAMFRLFPIVRCKEHEFNNAKRPCNYYHMKMCLGPCVYKVDQSHYIDIVQSAIRFLKGENKEAIQQIEQKMHEYARKEEFEQATIFRDILTSLKEISKKQRIIIEQVEDGDFIGCDESLHKISFHVLRVKSGSIVAHHNFEANFELGDKNEALVSFLLQFYENRDVPIEIYLPFLPNEVREIQAILNSNGRVPKFQIPKIGDKKALLDNATSNAKFFLEELNRKYLTTEMSLQSLAKILDLETIPERIECMDISNMGGTAIVASVVSFLNGKPDKSSYRKYNIELDGEAPDDFGSIYLVTLRRLKRAIVDQEFPDLLLIDGGKGQLSSAMRAKEELELTTPPIVSIAKARTSNNPNSVSQRSNERLFRDPNSQPIPLVSGTPEFRLCTQIRDEAHRFAITHHRKKRKEVRQTPLLEKADGIGPALRRRLMDRFGSLDIIKTQSPEKIAEVPGISLEKAERLLEFLKQEIN